MTAIRKRTWTDGRGEPRHAWLVDYRDSAGKRRAKQFSRKREAEAWATQAAWQVSQGTHTPDRQSITVSIAARQWIERAHRDKLEPTTITAYDQHARLHIEPLCGAVKLSQMTAPMVADYRDQLLDKLSRPMAVRVLRSLTSIIAKHRVTVKRPRWLSLQSSAVCAPLSFAALAGANWIFRPVRLPSTSARTPRGRSAHPNPLPAAEPFLCPVPLFGRSKNGSLGVRHQTST